jgi:iduronate 2-sulfatase
MRLPAAALLLACVSTFAAEAKRLNVLLLVSDDCRASMGCYGGPALTPNLDKLAAQGVRFDRTYCQYALCNPSRASFLTGLRPDTTKVLDNAVQFRANVPDAVTLPELFKHQGYSVARIGKLYHYGVPKEIGTNGLDDPRSWEKVWNPRGRDCDDEDKIFAIIAGQGADAPANVKVGTNNYGATLSWLAAEGTDAEQTDGKIAAQAQAFLREKRTQPFFLAVGFFRPHTPYVSPKAYFDLYPKDKLSLPGSPDRAGRPTQAYFSTAKADYGMNEPQKRSVIQAYYAAQSFMDAQFGLVLAELEQQGLAENTVVIFLSDHGYNLGEHGLWQKRALFDPSTRVPFIIRAPGLKGAGQPSPAVTELIDLYPTVADLCGLTPPKTLEGRSLRPLLDNPSAPWPYAAFTQVTTGGKKDAGVGRSIRTDRFRYTEWNEGKGGAELYDHTNDPGENHNLATDPAQTKVIAELRKRLREMK